MTGWAGIITGRAICTIGTGWCHICAQMNVQRCERKHRVRVVSTDLLGREYKFSVQTGMAETIADIPPIVGDIMGAGEYEPTFMGGALPTNPPPATDPKGAALPMNPPPLTDPPTIPTDPPIPPGNPYI